MSTLFASFLGYNPIGSLLRPSGELARLPKADASVLTSKEYFPHLISGPFHHGLVIVFSVAIAMSVAGAVISLLRGGQFYFTEPASQPAPALAAAAVAANGSSADRQRQFRQRQFSQRRRGQAGRRDRRPASRNAGVGSGRAPI